ncbi:Receptor-like protein kinase [Quillaja saponaria]|uniref:Receptor-like protein kinase n=1 Tax=Quillaja saponaria TaxID=32244 RepID=A0AAD7M3Z7_QUISA|nr:Receptor-like protein kinase [Quillaja saponaria]
MTKLTPTCLHVLPSYSILFFLLFIGHTYSQLYDQEHAALLKIKQYLQNPPFLSHWTPTNTSHCTWSEINCTSDSVTGISFVNTNITQTIPPFICDLKNLTHIEFQYNYIPGEFPKALYNCSKLEYLDLSQNYFVGKIPDDIDRMGSLRYIDLGANNFSGDIPASIGRLQELRSLRLYQCPFNGSFPPEIGNLSNLEELKLSLNKKLPPSKLPSNFTQLKKLKVLEITESNLIGGIPEMIGEMVGLEYLDLSLNGLNGKIPIGLFTLKNLRILYLYKNRLSGEIPGVIEALNLTEIDLSDNNLTGKIPEEFGKLEKLTGLSLSTNQLSGEIPESMGRLPALIDFGVFINNLSGPLPPDFGRNLILETFQVASNNFTGRLPEQLCSSGKLVGVVAFDNNLSGELPKTLGNCNSLQTVMIYNNEFSGNIPSGLWTSLNLTTLLIRENKFTGELPDKLSGKLSLLDISYNQFSGKIPSGVSSWRNLVVFEASHNMISGTIPRELTALPMLTTLLLDQNQLTGSLLSDIVSWKSLTTLNLSMNLLFGEIPEEVGRLPHLTYLDLSENQFSGKIPSQIGHQRFTELNLSSNLLTGRIPSDLENSVYSRSFLNNSGLCTTTSMLNLNICGSGQQKASKGSSIAVALIISLVIVAFIVALLSSLLVIRAYRKRKQALDSTWKLTSFQRLSFTESNILSGLTENSVIGSGGSGKVYRIAINRSGDVVAVKKIWDNRKLDQKLENEFLAEVKILSSIRHSNIVKLLCCISDGNSKLLVYEYLENRSLDRWLHRKNRSSTMSGSVHHIVLDWPKRLHIAIGAAQGLCYMHHDCSPPIVHRDVKTSNVLLDSEFNAKIADFGLAKMLIKPGELATMSAVAGSFGYIAPEYAHTTRVNEKIDVYSFGVILLELTTGREANYGDEYSSLADWAWRHIQEGNSITDALDEEIREPCYLDEMCSVFRLGVICTGTLPSTRPSMKEVLQMLRQCCNPLVYGEKNVKGNYDVVPLLKNSKRERTLESD